MHSSGEGRYRVVLDTNVYISMYGFPYGKLAPISHHFHLGTFITIISPFITNEFGRIARDVIGMEEKSIQSTLRQMAHIAEIVQPDTVKPVVPNDPDDDHIIACAVTGQADLIVSGDKHLRSLKNHGAISIVHPSDFGRMLEGM